jgi:hypothetical protein
MSTIKVPSAPRRKLSLARLSLLPAAALAAVLAIVVTQSVTAARTSLHHGSVDPLTRIGLKSSPSTGPGGHVGGSVAASNPSGVPMPLGNLPGWKQVFTDNFTTSVPLGGFSGCVDRSSIMSSTCAGLPKSVAAKLWAYPDGWRDNHTGTYYPSKVLSIHNGVLDYYLHTSGNTHMVAAVEPKIPGGIRGNGMQYGAYAIRFKSTLIAGYKTAFLLWPDSEKWPTDGEIDFPEGNLNSVVGAAMHFQGGTSLRSQNAYVSKATYATWHTAVIEWTPTECRFILDGRTIGTSVAAIPDTPMHWVLQSETVRGPAPADNIAGHIYIAWITAYART